jgi:hypothetical protein
MILKVNYNISSELDSGNIIEENVVEDVKDVTKSNQPDNIGIKGYNDRLFNSDALRRFYHNARFNWAAKVMSPELDGTGTVVELGCFDGRFVDHVGSGLAQYLGLDADWEGGLQVACQKYASNKHFEFRKTLVPQELDSVPDKAFATAVSLETLEHIPDHLLDGYLRQLRRITTGGIVATVPNEKGPLFLVKWFLKKVLYQSSEGYTALEVIFATIGRLDKVARNDHKGFDYRIMGKRIEACFGEVRYHAIPFRILPLWLSPTIGITSKR